MTKNPSNKVSDDSRAAIRGMSLTNLSAIIEVMVQLYGDKGHDMTVVEVMELHPDLVTKLDGDREAGGVKLSDKQMSGMTHAIEVDAVVRDARAVVLGATEKKEDKVV